MAILYYEKALEEKPDSEEVREMLKDLKGDEEDAYDHSILKSFFHF